MMCERLCRICAKSIQEKDPIKLFDNKNKILLLQLKSLTGVKLKSSLGLPKLMCCECKKDLANAYKFREDFLKVQASFKIKNDKRSRRKNNGLMQATEFVQVFVVKEEKDIIGANNEDFYEAVQEKEINVFESEDFVKKQNLSFTKENNDEVNALELKPNEENTLVDTKISLKDIIYYKKNDFDIIPLSEDDLCNDEEYTPETELLTTKESKSNRKSKKTTRQTIEGKNVQLKREITKVRNKPKEATEHPNIFICDQCGNHFTCRHHFKLHLRRHSGDKRCACELCPDKFFTSSELRRHMRRHTGERPFACKFCDRRFTDYSTRIKHERTHTNERPFMCSQCGKSFTTSYILKNHMLTHTGERHFKCDVCNKAFTRRTHLVVHFRSIMHKQAVEKNKLPISQDDLPQSHCLIPQTTHNPTFIV